MVDAPLCLPRLVMVSDLGLAAEANATINDEPVFLIRDDIKGRLTQFSQEVYGIRNLPQYYLKISNF